MSELMLLTNAFATLAMVGLIWFVQVVHYPLFAKVGNSCFAARYAPGETDTQRVVVRPAHLERQVE